MSHQGDISHQSPGASGVSGHKHGSAAVVTTTADLPPTAAGRLNTIEGQTFDGFQAAPGSLGNMQMEYNVAMGQPGPSTPPPPGEPARAFLSNASTPAQAPGRRSPFGDFRPSPSRSGPEMASPPAPPRTRIRAASAPRSRSPPPPAPATVAETIRKLQLQIDNLEKQRADDRKWLVENARRIDAMEAQARAQTREAMEYARAKCLDADGRIHDMDVRLRAELDDSIPKLLSSLEAKIASALPDIVETHVKALVGEKVKERIDSMDQTIKGFDQSVRAQQHFSEQHQAYLKARVDAKPGEEQTLVSYFKYLEEEVNKLKNVQTTNPDSAQTQKIVNETKGLVYQMGQDLKKDYELHLGHVGASMAQHQHDTEDRFKAVETEVMLMKVAFSHVPSPSTLRVPPGYPNVNLKGAYAGHDGCGGAAGHGDCGAPARAGAGAPGDRCGGDIPEENSLEELQDPEEYSQDLEADSLEELQDPEEDFQLEDAIATTLTN